MTEEMVSGTTVWACVCCVRGCTRYTRVHVCIMYAYVSVYFMFHSCMISQLALLHGS